MNKKTKEIQTPKRAKPSALCCFFSQAQSVQNKILAVSLKHAADAGLRQFLRPLLCPSPHSPGPSLAIFFLQKLNLPHY